jgi:hypothetical protein
MRDLSGEEVTHIFFSVGAFFSVSWVVGSARMAPCTLVYVSSKMISLQAFFQQPTEMGLVLLRLFLLQKL